VGVNGLNGKFTLSFDIVISLDNHIILFACNSRRLNVRFVSQRYTSCSRELHAKILMMNTTPITSPRALTGFSR
jgi:hypothetical protein